MSRIKRIFILTFILFFFATISYAQFPHIKGLIKINVPKGILECNLEVSNCPAIKGYSILLNTGLNIKYLRDSSDSFNYYYERYYNSEESFEAFQYYLPNNDNTARFLPTKFKLSYVGAFPVFSDTLTMSDGGDWKGNIAFNGKYIRATEQSAWYPIFYDTLNDVIYDKVTYDINVICEGGESIYINGSPPTKNYSANLKSDTPVSMLLFAGNYDFIQKDKTWFVNTFLNDKQQSELSTWSNKIISFYESKLNIKYGSAVTILGASPVSKKQNWMFTTYPTIAVVGRPPYDIKGSFYKKKQELKDSSVIKNYSHELGHYYFGTYFVPNAELKWMFLEGITEYISLKIFREILGESYYKKSILDNIEQLKNYQPISLNTIKQENEIDDNYRYNYIPLLLIALEKQIGEEKIWEWLNIVLTSKNVKTNYAFFKSSLLQSGVTKVEFDNFENAYIKSSDAKMNVFKIAL